MRRHTLKLKRRAGQTVRAEQANFNQTSQIIRQDQRCSRDLALESHTAHQSVFHRRTTVVSAQSTPDAPSSTVHLCIGEGRRRKGKGSRFDSIHPIRRHSTSLPLSGQAAQAKRYSTGSLISSRFVDRFCSCFWRASSHGHESTNMNHDET